MFLSKKKKNIIIFHLKIIIFYSREISQYNLHMHVFVMVAAQVGLCRTRLKIPEASDGVSIGRVMRKPVICMCESKTQIS